MQQLVKQVLRSFLRINFRGVLSLPLSPGLIRFWTTLLTAVTFRTSGVRKSVTRIGVNGHLLRSQAAELQGALLFLHGGGYVFGSEKTHKAITTALAGHIGADVFVPDYRLAPERPYPAAVEDAIESYRALLEKYPASSIAIGGDSAGGGLTLCTALALKESGLPQPACLMLISPWADLGLSGDSVVDKDALDPLLSRKILDKAAGMYRGGLQASDPRVSPLFADLSGLPPSLIHVGSDEVLLSDSLRLQQALEAAGAVSTLKVFDRMWHDFQLHAQILDEADESLKELGQFVREHISGGSPTPI